MSRVFSFRDLRLIPELSKYSEIELLHPILDPTVNAFLEVLGFDLNYPVVYEPSKHRDMQGKVAVGFRAVGEISLKRAFINSPLCSVDERLIAASKQDMSLTRELAQLAGRGSTFAAGENRLVSSEDFPPELIEADYDDVTSQIAQLEAIRDHIRGEERTESGARKARKDA